MEGREDLRETEGTGQKQPLEPVHPGSAAGFYPSLSGTVRRLLSGTFESFLLDPYSCPF